MWWLWVSSFYHAQRHLCRLSLSPLVPPFEVFLKLSFNFNPLIYGDLLSWASFQLYNPKGNYPYIPRTYFSYVPITYQNSSFHWLPKTANHLISFIFDRFGGYPTYSAMIPNLYTEYVTSCAFQADALATRLTYLRNSYIRSVSPRRLTLPSQSGRHGSWSAHKNHLLFTQSVVLPFWCYHPADSKGAIPILSKKHM